MVDADVAEATEALRPLISRPKLSDKLLGKPLLRFLHDIISNVPRRPALQMDFSRETSLLEPRSRAKSQNAAI